MDEGPKYYFRHITWNGNYLYDDKTLSAVLGIKSGSPYSKETLDKRLNYNPTGQDVTSLYMNDGYLFFQIEPVENKVEGDSIDIEMRLTEGRAGPREGHQHRGQHQDQRTTCCAAPCARCRAINSTASCLFAPQREMATLGYFDPEKIGINPMPKPGRWHRGHQLHGGGKALGPE
ncbi:MAG: POTRA domain-containing protein [Hymenobacter sp.]